MRHGKSAISFLLAIVMCLSFLAPAIPIASAEEVAKYSVVFTPTPETAEVSVYGENSPEAEPIPDEEDGSWLLAPGEYFYSAVAEGYESKLFVPFTVEDEALNVEFALTAVETNDPLPVAVSFTVTPAEAEAVITVADAEGETVAAAEDGSYLLAAGEYTYTVTAEGYEDAAGTFKVEDETVTVSVELTAKAAEPEDDEPEDETQTNRNLDNGEEPELAVVINNGTSADATTLATLDAEGTATMTFGFDDEMHEKEYCPWISVTGLTNEMTNVVISFQLAQGLKYTTPLEGEDSVSNSSPTNMVAGGATQTATVPEGYEKNNQMVEIFNAGGTRSWRLSDNAVSDGFYLKFSLDKRLRLAGEHTDPIVVTLSWEQDGETHSKSVKLGSATFDGITDGFQGQYSDVTKEVAIGQTWPTNNSSSSDMWNNLSIKATQPTVVDHLEIDLWYYYADDPTTALGSNVVQPVLYTTSDQYTLSDRGENGHYTVRVDYKKLMATTIGTVYVASQIANDKNLVGKTIIRKATVTAVCYAPEGEPFARSFDDKLTLNIVEELDDELVYVQLEGDSATPDRRAGSLATSNYRYSAADNSTLYRLGAVRYGNKGSRPSALKEVVLAFPCENISVKRIALPIGFKGSEDAEGNVTVTNTPYTVTKVWFTTRNEPQLHELNVAYKGGTSGGVPLGYKSITLVDLGMSWDDSLTYMRYVMGYIPAGGEYNDFYVRGTSDGFCEKDTVLGTIEIRDADYDPVNETGVTTGDGYFKAPRANNGSDAFFGVQNAGQTSVSVGNTMHMAVTFTSTYVPHSHPVIYLRSPSGLAFDINSVKVTTNMAIGEKGPVKTTREITADDGLVVSEMRDNEDKPMLKVDLTNVSGFLSQVNDGNITSSSKTLTVAWDLPVPEDFSGDSAYNFADTVYVAAPLTGGSTGHLDKGLSRVTSYPFEAEFDSRWPRATWTMFRWTDGSTYTISPAPELTVTTTAKRADATEYAVPKADTPVLVSSDENKALDFCVEIANRTKSELQGQAIVYFPIPKEGDNWDESAAQFSLKLVEAVTDMTGVFGGEIWYGKDVTPNTTGAEPTGGEWINHWPDSASERAAINCIRIVTAEGDTMVNTAYVFHFKMTIGGTYDYDGLSDTWAPIYYRCMTYTVAGQAYEVKGFIKSSTPICAKLVQGELKGVFFLDENGDGIMNGADTTFTDVEGWKVALQRDDGSVLAEMAVPANGSFKFDDLDRSESYRILVTNPVKDTYIFAPVSTQQGTVNSVTGQGDHSTGLSEAAKAVAPNENTQAGKGELNVGVMSAELGTATITFESSDLSQGKLIPAGETEATEDPVVLTGIYTDSFRLKMPTPEPAQHYAFDGWQLNGEGAKIMNFSDAQYQYGMEDRAYTAAWKVLSYTLSFNKNGGTGTTPATQNPAFFADVTVGEATLTKAGYIFRGWALTADATEALVGVDGGDIAAVNFLSVDDGGTATLYAVWEQKAAINPSITLENWVYNTPANSPVVTGNDGNGRETITYKAEGASAFSSTVPTSAGTHTVKVKIAETDLYQAGEATATFQITKAPITVTAEIADWTYGGTASTPGVTAASNPGNAAADEIVYTYSVKGEDSFSATVPTNAGEYTLKAVVPETANYQSGTGTKDFKINKAEATISFAEQIVHAAPGAEPFINELTNTGDGAVSYESLTPSVATVAEDGTVTVVAGGSATIQAHVTDGANYTYPTNTATFTVAVGAIDLNLTVELADWTYGETPAVPVVTGNVENTRAIFEYKAADADDSAYDTQRPTEAGDYKVRVTVVATANYNETSAEDEFSILKADIEPAVTLSGWTYGEEAKTPTVSGNSGNGAVSYLYAAEGSDEFSAEVPTAVGAYTVKAVIDETANYNGGEATNTFAISKADPALRVAIEGWTYGEEANEPTLTAPEGVTATYSYAEAGSDSFSDEVPENAGNYVVKASFAGNDNYNEAEATASFTIAKAAAEINFPADPINKVYGDAAFENAVTNTGDGAVTYSSTKTSVATVAADGKVTIVGAGTTVLKATVADSDNYSYAVKTVICELNVAKAPIEPEVTLESWAYGEEPNEPVLAEGSNPGEGDVSYSYAVRGSNSFTGNKPVNAGEYTVKVTVGETANYQKGTATADFEITKVGFTPSVTIEDWTYGKTASTPVLSGNASGGQVTYTYAAAGEDEFSPDVPVNAGNYVVKATVEETQNYGAAEATAEFTIVKANITVRADDKASKYGEDLLDLTYVVSGDKVASDNLDTAFIASSEVTSTSPVTADGYPITVAWNGEANENYVVEFLDGVYMITKADLEVTASGYSGTYDAQAHGITVDIGDSDAVVYYAEFALNADNYTEGATELSYTDVGEYDVYYFVYTGNYDPNPVKGSQHVSITKADPFVGSPVVTPDDLTATYGDTLADVSLPDVEGGTWTWDNQADTSVGNAGTNYFPATFTPNDTRNYNVLKVSVPIAVDKAQIAPALTIEGWTYGDEPNDPVLTEGSNPGDGEVTKLYSADGETWSETVPTEAGDYFVKAQIAETANYYGGETEPVAFTIDKAQIAPAVTIEGWVYGEEPNDPALTEGSNPGDGEVSYLYSADGENWSETVPTEAGDYFVKAVIAETANYYGTETEPFAFTIDKAQIEPAVEIEGWTYGDEPNEPALTEGSNPGEGEVSYSYAAQGSEDFSEEVPTEAGDYTVKAVIAETANYYGGEATCDFVIDKADITPVVEIEGWTYGEEPNEPALTEGSNPGEGEVSYLYSADGENWSETVPTEAGAYTVKAVVAETDNYYGGEATCDFVIDKADIAPVVEIEGWTYGEEPNEPALTEGSNPGEGEVSYLYSADGENWSETVPTEAGDYFVKAQIAETANYYGGETEPFAFTIDKAQIEPAVEIEGWTYGEEPNAPSYTGTNPGEGEVSFSYAAKGSEDFTAEVPTEAGTYTVKAIVAETANYCGGEATCEFTIEKAPAPKEIGEGEAPTAILGLVDNDKPQELVTPPEKLPDGYEKILYSIDFGKTWIETVPTGTEPGNYVVMTKYVGDDNHTDFFGDPIPVTIDRKTFTVTFAVNGGSAVAEQKVKDGDKVVKPDDPTKENAVFDGWYADDAFETKFDFASAITADTTLYAKWTPTNIKYVIIIGDNAEWTRGSNNGLLIASNADFAKFVSVIVDGKEIPNTCYKAESGSTHITLTKEYLESLSLGSHSFTIQSSDGSASTHFTIKAASGTTPSTGDDNNVVVWALLLVLSAAGLGAVLTLNKKRSY